MEKRLHPGGYCQNRCENRDPGGGCPFARPPAGGAGTPCGDGDGRTGSRFPVALRESWFGVELWLAGSTPGARAVERQGVPRNAGSRMIARSGALACCACRGRLRILALLRDRSHCGETINRACNSY